jgi:hypothetical protein
MFHWICELSEKRRVIACLCWSGWLYAALSCMDDAPSDSDRLSSLSSDQLRSLCTEVIDAWPATPDGPIRCDNGNTYYLDREGLSACGNQTTSCSARVGEWRDCMRALAATPCETATPEPEQCRRLPFAAGCGGLALPVSSECTPPRPEQVAEWSGLYRFSNRTRNSNGCDSEGEPLPAQGYFLLTTRFVAAVPYSPLGDTRMLVPLECESIEACRELTMELSSASDPNTPLLALPYLTLLDNPLCGPDNYDTLRSSVIDSSGDACELIREEQVLLPQPDGTLRIERRSFQLPAPPEGQPCYFTDAVQGSCVSLDVLRAERVPTL